MKTVKKLPKAKCSIISVRIIWVLCDVLNENLLLLVTLLALIVQK